MPYESDAQRRLFHSKNSPVSPEKVKEWDRASKGMKMPERMSKSMRKQMRTKSKEASHG